MTSHNLAERERQLDEVVTAYLKAVESGGAPSQQEWLARYPQLADGLAEFFTAQNQLAPLAKPLRVAMPGADAPTTGLGEGARSIPAPGDRIQYFGDYELLEEIGRGGMGVVYKARQVSLNRVVALKMILTGQLANDDDVKRFRAEAEAAAKLQHEGIVPVFEVGKYEGHHYFTMAFVEGASLAHRLTEGMLPPKQAAELTRKVAKAVSYAHTEGVIHRDLKPANILLDRNGEPRLTDFGLAKKVQGDVGTPGLTATGQILGTPSYMPPEQASGKKGSVGTLADVYSLGAILYCLLTGRPPFQADNPFDTLMQVVEQEPAPPRELNAKMPRDLETICLTCLQKEPHKRYATASALVEDLDRFLSGQAIAARPTRTWERIVKWARRRPAAAALVIVLMFAWIAPVVTGIIFNAYAQSWARTAKKSSEDALTLILDLEAARKEAANDRQAAGLANADAERDRAAAKADRERADIAAKRIGRDIYVADMRLAQQAWDETRLFRVLELLEGQRPEKTVGIDLRGFEWHYLKRLCHTERFTLDAPVGAGGFCVGYNHDGTRLVTCGSNQVLKVWDAATGKELRFLRGHSLQDAVWVAVFSPDGKWIASGTGEYGNATKGEVKLWDAETGKLIRDLQTEGRGIMSLAFNSEGTRLAAATAEKAIKIWDPATGELVHTIPTPTKVNGIAYSPVANHLAWVTEYNAPAGNYLGELHFWDVTVNKPHGAISGYLGRLHRVAFSPDGKRIAVSGDMGVKVWDTASTKEIHHFAGTVHRFTSLDVKWSHDGKRLASGHGSQIKIWDATTGHELQTIKGHLRYVHSLAFSRDGRHLASTDGWQAKVWDTTKAQDPLTVPGEMGWWYGGVAFSPSGKELAVGTGTGPVRILDPGSGKTLRTLEGHTQWVLSLAYSGDGKRLVTASNDKTARIWDVEAGKQIRILEHTDEVNGVAFSADGTLIATGSGERYQRSGATGERPRGEVKLWDAKSGKLIRAFAIVTVDRSRPLVTSIAISPDGNWLAAGLTQHARPKEGQPAGEFHSGGVPVWEISTGKEVTFLSDYQEVHNLAFSRDGSRLAACGLHGSIKFWNIANWMERFTFKGHTEEANGVAFSPDSARVASVSRDQTVRVWDTSTGQETMALRADAIMRVAFSPDGHRIAATGPTLRIWDATPRE
jgi:eukaryotic-like serine/threonine-protein kinase